MIGAIAGDIIGSVYEAHPIKTKKFPLFHPDCRFTDDSVLSIAVAQAILEDRDYQTALWEMGRKYPHAGYGGSFIRWLSSQNPEPYNSWGNGSAMRVSPVGFAFNTVETVLQEAARTAEISHTGEQRMQAAARSGPDVLEPACLGYGSFGCGCGLGNPQADPRKDHQLVGLWTLRGCALRPQFTFLPVLCEWRKGWPGCDR